MHGDFLFEEIDYKAVLDIQVFGFYVNKAVLLFEKLRKLFKRFGVFLFKIGFEKAFVLFQINAARGAKGKHDILFLLPLFVDFFAVYHGEIVGENTLEIFVQIEGVGKAVIIYAGRSGNSEADIFPPAPII